MYLKLKLKRKLRRNRFPTKLDIIRAFLFEKDNWIKDGNKGNPTNSVIADVLTEKVENIFRSAGVKTVRKDKIKEKIQTTYNSRLQLLKTPRFKRHSDEFANKRVSYLADMSNLLNVSDNRDILKKRNKSSRKTPPSKVTKKMHQSRQIISKTETCHNNRYSIRNAALICRRKCYVTAKEEVEMDGEETVIRDEMDQDYELSKLPTIYTKRVDLSDIVETQSRYLSSDRCTSALVNATLRTFSIPTIIDRSKLRRAQKRKFAEISKDPMIFGGGLYYDSRKDRSLIRKRRKIENGKFKFYTKIVREEHYSLVSEPDGLFMGYVATEKGDAEHSSEAIISFLRKKKVFKSVSALGCDGANVNVGLKGGINHIIETTLKRPVHWFICQLHGNELPLRKLIEKYDGPTTGPKSYSGVIGKALANVCELPVVKFNMFKDTELLPKMPDLVYKKLSNDQKYLYRIVNALISGDFPASLANLNIGAMGHSRWMTTGSRICKLYASTTEPSLVLKMLASYVVEVYAPTWFQIKKHERAIDGPKNLFFLIKKSNLIKDKKAKIIVRKCIQRNAFFGHSENVLLAQLASKKQSVRANAVYKILKIREGKPSGKVRKFKVPQIKFDAKTWTDIIKFKRSIMMEPPLTLNMTDDELISVIKHPLKVPKFKCHTQMVERAVKEVTRVSLKAVDHEKRNSMIKATLINRAKYPKVDSVQDFKKTLGSINYLPKI